jgi:hypothetical protein
MKSWGQEMYDSKNTELMENMLNNKEMSGEDFIGKYTLSSDGNNKDIDKVDSD